MLGLKSVPVSKGAPDFIHWHPISNCSGQYRCPQRWDNKIGSGKYIVQLRLIGYFFTQGTLDMITWIQHTNQMAQWSAQYFQCNKWLWCWGLKCLRNQVNAMVADAMTHCVTRLSASMVSTMKKDLNQPYHFYICSNYRKCIFLVSLKKLPHKRLAMAYTKI